MGWSLSQIHLENDVAGWLPKDDPQTVILDWYQKHFPNEDRLLVSWDDCSLTDTRVSRLVTELSGVERNGVREGGSPYVADVKLPADLLKRMMREEIPFATALQRTQGLLTGNGPLCIRLTDAGRLRGEFMRKEILRLANDEHRLNARLVQQSMPMPSSEGLSVDDEASWKLHDALTEYLRSQPLFDLQISWPRMHVDREKTELFRKSLTALLSPEAIPGADSSACVEETFYIPGSMAAVSVGLNDAGSADHKLALADVLAAAEAAGIPYSSLHLGGRPVAGTALNEAVKRSGWNRDIPWWNLPRRSPMLTSSLVTILLSIVVLRSLRLTILVQLVSILAALLAVSLVPVTGGSMNMVLVVMPPLLIVLTTSGAIHLCNYWKNSGVSDPTESVHRATAVCWLPCILASSTTAIGLASLCVSSLVPVRDFGIYASIGCGISFFVTLYLLPALMLYWPQSPPKPESVDTSVWRGLGLFVFRWRYPVAAVCLAATVACGYGLTRFRTETKVIRYFPDDSRVVQDYNFLEENLSGIVSVDTIVKFDQASQQQIPFMDRARKVMEVQQALQKHPEVSGTLSLSSFLDLSQPDTSSMSRMQRMQVRRRESEIEKRVHEKLAAGGKESAGLSSMLTVATEAADWRRPGDAALNNANDELWRITCQSSIMSDYDYAVLTKELDAISSKHLALVGSPGTGHIVTGLIPIFLRTQQALLESLISSFALAFLVIGAVMALQLRSVTAAAFAMLPNLMPVIVVFGLVSWAGIRIDIGTMITGSVALGIAVDGTLHVMTWFQILIRQGIPRREAVAKAMEHCGPALWQTSAAVGIGMLALYPVELLLISRFGWIMAGMIFAALIGDAILLPALLAGPLGAVLEKVNRSKQDIPSAGAGGADSSAAAATSTQKTTAAGENAAAATPVSTESGARTSRPHFGRIPGISTRHASGN